MIASFPLALVLSGRHLLITKLKICSRSTSVPLDEWGVFVFALLFQFSFATAQYIESSAPFSPFPDLLTFTSSCFNTLSIKLAIDSSYWQRIPWLLIRLMSWAVILLSSLNLAFRHSSDESWSKSTVTPPVFMLNSWLGFMSHLLFKESTQRVHYYFQPLPLSPWWSSATNWSFCHSLNLRLAMATVQFCNIHWQTWSMRKHSTNTFT
jgi:hypothetical protein